MFFLYIERFLSEFYHDTLINMAKGMYHYIGESWKQPDVKTLRERMIEWRASGSVVKIDKPLRLDRARALGYKAKPGFSIVRVKINRGGRKRPRPAKARKKGRTLSVRKTLAMSYKEVAEQRAGRKFQNLEVYNSYWVGKDGENYFFEIIMVDPNNSVIKSDKGLKFLSKKTNRNRTFRGMTSSGKKSRNLK